MSAIKVLRSMLIFVPIPDKSKIGAFAMRRGAFRTLISALSVRLVFMITLLVPLAAQATAIILPSLLPNLVDYYTFDNPVSGNPAKEDDQGFGGTDINLINGGAAMRVNGAAHPGSGQSLQTMQVTPTVNSNNDWKAGIYNSAGVSTMSAFNHVTQISLAGWVEMTGTNPNLNSGTANPTDIYNAIGLFGILQGGTATQNNGHNVRALLEIEETVVNGVDAFRLVALGRRVDSGSSYILAATTPWPTLFPQNEWVFLTATFDYDNGVMALYVNGLPTAASYTAGGDPWAIAGPPEPDFTSSTNPGGIKIGGSYPQNTQEFNACNCQFDDLMFFNRVLTPAEVLAQYQQFEAVPEPSTLSLAALGLLIAAGGALRRRKAILVAR